MLDAALNDRVIQEIVAAADTGDGRDCLDAYVVDRLCRPEPGHRARALTVAGFRGQNAQTETVLAAASKTGFLGTVARKAGRRYARAGWARHWLGAMSKANDLIEFWRYAQLAIGSADVRALLNDRWIETVPSVLRPHLESVIDQLVTATDEGRKKLEDTLFGLKAPARELALLLADTPTG